MPKDSGPAFGRATTHAVEIGRNPAPVIAVARSNAFEVEVRKALEDLEKNTVDEFNVASLIRLASVNRSTLYSKRKDPDRSYVHQALLDEIDDAIKRRCKKVADAKRQTLPEVPDEEEASRLAPTMAILANELIVQRDAADKANRARLIAERRVREALLDAHTFAFALVKCWPKTDEVPKSLTEFLLGTASELGGAAQSDVHEAEAAGATLAAEATRQPAVGLRSVRAGASITALRKPEG